MNLSYLIWELYNIDRVLNKGKVLESMNEFVSCFLFALASTCYSFAYWTYASQYIKTCKILPYFLERAKILLTQHNEKDENENDLSGLSEEHLIKLKQMDCQLLQMKQRIETIRSRFQTLDISVLVCLFISLFPSLYFTKEKDNHVREQQELDAIYRVLLLVVIAVLLAISAYLISRFVKNSTN